MLAKESSRFDLPEELLEVLPQDPFEQLDVARKITSIALSTRVDSLESELSELRQHLADRDSIIAGMESQLQSLDASFAEASENLAAAHQEKVPPFLLVWIFNFRIWHLKVAELWLFNLENNLKYSKQYYNVWWYAIIYWNYY